LFKTSCIKLDQQVCIAVDSDLRSLSHANVFAAGDIATLLEEPHEKNGVYAVRHAEFLYRSFMQILSGFTWRAKRLARQKPFEPQRHYLALIDLSDGSAIAVKGTWSYKGKSMLWLKKWIDNRFVRQFYIALNKRS
jgi:selenide,water dikinase